MNTFFSLAIICGDAGLNPLPRLLRSILVRPDGPLTDEVVIGWNGTDDAAFEKSVGIPAGSLAEAISDGATLTGRDEKGNSATVPLTILRQKWEGDFAKARNETFAAARGEWIMWADTDDIVSTIADEDSPDGLKAVNAICRQYGVPEFEASGGKGGGTMRDYLRQLPFNTNCVNGTYDYAINASGECEVRQRVRRIVRKSAGWVWEHKIHEALYLVGPVPDVSVYQPAFLVRHYPNVDEQMRLMRNASIVKTLEESPGTKDARHDWDRSSVHAALGDWDKVIADLDQALQKTEERESIYLYRLAKVTAAFSINRAALALQEALAAIALFPDRQDAYFAAAEALARQAEWKAVIAYFELGASKQAVLDKVDYVVSRCVNPRIRAATAYCELGSPEKGIALCEEALRLVPSSYAAAHVLQTCTAAAKKKEAVDNAQALIKAMIDVRDFDTAQAVVDVVAISPALRVLGTRPEYQVLAESVAVKARAAASVPVSTPIPEWVRELDKSYPGCASEFAPSNGHLVDARALIEKYTGTYGEQVLAYRSMDDGQAVVARRATKTPLTFYCPIGVAPWDPNFPEVIGTGGSETSAIMLARELGARGHPITFYCPGGQRQPNADKGVVWYGLHDFDPRKLKDREIVIAHRAPFILRNPDMKARTYVWHQDNGYGNTWFWSKEIDSRTAGSLHVSEWARAGLIKALEPVKRDDIFESKHKVIGNGIPRDWVYALAEKGALPERNPHRVIFASNPTRGLDTLLNCWPRLKTKVPDAELQIFCDFDAAIRISGAGTILSNSNVPGIVQLFQKMQKMTKDQKLSVFFRNLTPQPQLTKAMWGAGVYAYPGGAMPEGFGVALVEAVAAGLAVVYPRDGALPDVLPDDTYQVSKPCVTEDAAQEFLEHLIDAVKNGDRTVDRKKNSLAVWERHGWPVVADRFEEAVR